MFEQDVMSEAPEAAAPAESIYDESDFAPLAGIGSRAQGMVPAKRRAPELGDMVTPGDFWLSPSLDSVAVLHRPAGT